MESAIRNDLFRSHSNRQSCRMLRDPHPDLDLLLSLNVELDNLRRSHIINERSIERFLKVLEDSGASDLSHYWLIMARIFELALFCAGHYANHGEFSAAGDLLVNPRKILIHRNGYPDPIVKQRHGRISEQLKEGRRCRKHLMLFRKHEVTLEIAKPAILPYLFEQMEHSRKLAPWYLDNARERIKKIANTIGFLSAGSVTGFEDLHKQMQMASSKTRRFIGDHLCRFDMQYFRRLGQEFKNVIENSNNTYGFLA